MYLREKYDGVLKIKREAILELNSQPEICLAVINPDRAVKADSLLGGCRVIPLAVEKEVIEHFENTTAKFGGSIMEVRPFKPFRIGVVTTGEEIRSGRIKDAFGDVLDRIPGFEVEIQVIHRHDDRWFQFSFSDQVIEDILR